MTPDEIVERLGEAGENHPAWNAFCQEMADKAYGWDALNQAWHFFKDGWEAHMRSTFKFTQLF